MEIWETFDWLKLAEEYLENVRKLNAGIARVKAEPVRGMDGQMKKIARLNLLKEELIESRQSYKACMEKARLRGQISDD